VIAGRVLMLALPFLTQAPPGSPRPPSPRAGDTRPVASTTILPGPEGGKEAFEPSLTIDPAKPDRMVVVAMYGNPMAHGGRAIWVWDTCDGGRSWTGGRMRPPTVASKPATWAADVVAGIGRDGATVLTSMAGAHSPRTDGLGGIAVARRVRGDTAFAPAVLVMRDRLIDATDQATIYDKPWMTIDRHESSPYRGAVYVVAGAMDLPLPQRSWAETPLPLLPDQDPGDGLRRVAGRRQDLRPAPPDRGLRLPGGPRREPLRITGGRVLAVGRRGLGDRPSPLDRRWGLVRAAGTHRHRRRPRQRRRSDGSRPT